MLPMLCECLRGTELDSSHLRDINPALLTVDRRARSAILGCDGPLLPQDALTYVLQLGLRHGYRDIW